jgi:3-deoxy-manno-octulosonate cytidylyltransferase (CMP-KDO synthetase)
MLDRLVVATDDERISGCVRGFGGQAVMTSVKHRSGSDRIAEVIKKPGFSAFHIVVNIQGDEPLIDPKAVDLLAKAMINDAKLQMATLATGFESIDEINDQNSAKVVTDRNDRALYFSRSSIPFVRDDSQVNTDNYLKHIGMYAYRRDFIKKFTSWPEGRLERLEKLEQLRALENGTAIKIIRTNYKCLSIDSPKDIKSLVKHIKYQSVETL